MAMDMANFQSNESRTFTIDHKTGEIKNNKERFSSINVVPLGMIQSRVAWPGRDNPPFLPICKSPNNFIGYATNAGLDIGLPEIQECKTCPLSSWSDGKQSCQRKLYIPFIPWNLSDMQYSIFEVSRSGIAETVKTFQPKIVKGVNRNSFTNRVVMIYAKQIQKNGKLFAIPQYKILANNSLESSLSDIDVRDKFYELYSKAKEEIESRALPSSTRGARLVGMPMGHA